ncbi:MAG: GNAT family N-acetyltransferase [Pseudomonadota bacterium]
MQQEVITFRHANINDKDFILASALQLIKIEEDCQPDVSLPTSSNFQKHLMQWISSLIDSENHCVIITEFRHVQAACLIGTLELPKSPMLDFSLSGKIDLIWVEPAYRFQNIGRSLVSAAMEFFKENHVHHVDISHAYGNVKASNFWHNQGFKPAELTRRIVLKTS